MYLFNEVMSMSPEQRQSLRLSHQAQAVPAAVMGVEKIAKLSEHTGVDIATAAVIIMKHQPDSYDQYRKANFK
jgi:hypothetical protein